MFTSIPSKPIFMNYYPQYSAKLNNSKTTSENFDSETSNVQKDYPLNNL